MLALRFPQKSWPEHFSASKKLVVLVVMTTGLFWINAPSILLCFFLFSTLLLLSLGKTNFWFSIKLLKPLWPFIILILAWHVYTQSAQNGIIIILRLLIAICLANIVTCTTKTTDLLAVFNKVLKPFERFGLHTEAISMSIAIFLRFTPLILHKTETISLAFKARSGKRPTWHIVLPLIINIMDDADHVAMSLHARGGITKQ